MKISRIKKQHLIFFPIIIGFGIISLFINRSTIFSVREIAISILLFYLLIQLFLVYRKAIIVDKEGLYFSYLWNNGRRKDFKKIKWEDVDKVIQIRAKCFRVFPKVEPKKLYSFTSKEYIPVSDTYEDYEEILEEIIVNARNAEIQDGAHRVVEVWKAEKNK